MKPQRTDSASQSWFQSANCDSRYGAALLGVLALVLLIAATGERGRGALGYEREALSHLQWWRLFSAHLVHLNWQHALLNCAGLIVLWALFAREFAPARWLWIVSMAALCIDLGLWFRYPAVQWYLGASGVLHGVWAAGAYAAWRRADLMGIALMVLLIIKLGYEQHAGQSVFIGNIPVVLAAHGLGALGGLVAALLLPRTAAKSL
jgi:rhomboid family GlyGly-CTERM serine protease